MKLNLVQELALDVANGFLPVIPLKTAVEHYHRGKLDQARIYLTS